MESFKVLMIADVHMSNKLPYAKPVSDGMTDRFLDQLKLWDGVHKTVKKEGIDAVFILGDLFDRAIVDPVTLTHTIDVIVSTPCEVFILPGNHDANSLGGRFVVEAFSKIKNDRVKVIPNDECSSLQIPIGNFEFWPIAYKSIEDTYEELELVRKDMNKSFSNILLIHNSVIGAENNGWNSPDGLDSKKICKGFKSVYAGHFHKSQKFGDCGQYVGAPMQLNFGDTGREAGFLIVELKEDGSMTETHVNTGLPEFHVLNDKDKTVSAKKGDYLRYEIEATAPQWIKIEPELKALCLSMRKEMGIHASYVQKVLPNHKTRLKKTKGLMTFEDAISDYIDVTGATKKGLDKVRLKEIGDRCYHIAQGRLAK